MVVQKMAIAFVLITKLKIPSSSSGPTLTRHGAAGDNPLRLANEIDAALAKYGLGNDHRMCKAIHFFEGELRLIAECLRCAGPRKVNKEAEPAALAEWHTDRCWQATAVTSHTVGDYA
jgi:hypothetical protein